MKALVVVMAMAATAHAETAEQLTQTARNLARDGRCEALPAIGKRVHQLDDDYFTRVYSIDPVIAGCTPVDPRLQLGGPPSVTPLRVAPALAPTGSGKDPAIALVLSLGMTAGGLGMMVIGGDASEPALTVPGTILFAIGPTAGHIYAGYPASRGLAVRGIGALAGLAGFGLLLQCIDECHGDGNPELGAVLLVGGGMVYAAGALYEIGTAPDAAHRFNREHGLEATVVPTGNGVALVGTF